MAKAKKKEEEKDRTIHELLADVMSNIDKVAKSGENKGLGYTYASEADLLNVVQPLLAQRGIMLRKRSSEILINDFDERGRHRFLIKVVWSFEQTTEKFTIASILLIQNHLATRNANKDLRQQKHKRKP